MGQPLKKAPIILALADIRFLPIEAIDADKALIGKVQDGLRKIGYPQFLASKIVQITPIPDGTVGVRVQHDDVNRYDFFDLKKEWVITLDKGHLTVSTTEYTQWDDFRPRFETIADTVMRVLDSVQIQRIGYRTIDEVCPAPGEAIEEIINSQVVGGVLNDIGVPGISPSAARSICQVSGQVSPNDRKFSFIVGCEVLNGFDQPPPLPLELMNPPPTMPKIVPKQSRRDDGAFARLSIDVIFNQQQDVNQIFTYRKEELLDIIEEQKLIASKFFKGLIKPEKLAAWQ